MKLFQIRKKEQPEKLEKMNKQVTQDQHLLPYFSNKIKSNLTFHTKLRKFKGAENKIEKQIFFEKEK